MTDIAAFLRARLDEDEAAARACDMWPAPWSTRPNGSSQTVWSSNPGVSRVAVCEWSKTARHIIRWDPARVLADVEAKRAVLALHGSVTVEWGDAPDSLACRCCGTHYEYPADWPCPTLLALAQPYAGRPDFDPAWVSS